MGAHINDLGSFVKILVHPVLAYPSQMSFFLLHNPAESGKVADIKW
jgi:hypothetical protein